MAIELYKLNEYLSDLKTVYEDSVLNEKSVDELNKILEQIKHIERLIGDRIAEIESEQK